MNIDLDSKIMCERLIYSLNQGRNYKKAVKYVIKRIMNAKAHGVEIIIELKREQIKYAVRTGTLRRDAIKNQLIHYFSAYSLSDKDFNITINIHKDDELKIKAENSIEEEFI